MDLPISFMRLSDNQDLGGKTWEARLGRQDLGGKTWEARLGRKDLGGKTWEARLGRQDLGGKTWEARLGRQDLGGKTWEERVIALEDCLGLCDLSPDQVRAISEHEHVPEILAAALGTDLLRSESGPEKIRDM